MEHCSPAKIVGMETITFWYMNKVKVIGNLLSARGKWKSQQIGRVYSIKGVAPTIDTMSGGGREPKILVYEETMGIELDTQ